jgi:hypothetical protein
LALGALPWMHTKFVPLLAVLLFLLALRCGWHWRRLAALAGPVAVSLALWLFSFYVMYGEANPVAPYGSAEQANLGNENIIRGVLGLLFDQEFGTLLYTPFLLVALVGAASLVVGRAGERLYALGLLAAAAALLFSVTRVYMWWGGWSTPGRFLVPAIPLLAPLAAAGVARLRSTAGRGAVTTSVILGLAALLLGSVEPEGLRLFNRRDGAAELVTLVQGTAPLTAALPSFFLPDWASQMGRVVAWVAAVVAALAFHWWLGRRRARQPGEPVWAVLRPAMGVALCGSFLGGAAIPAAEGPPIVRQARLGAIEAYDAGRLVARDADSWRRLEPADFLRRLTVELAPDANLPREPERIILANGVDLPPGRYELRLWLTGTRPSSGRMAIWCHDVLGLVASREGSLANPAVLSFALPVSLPDLWFGVGGGFPVDRIQRVELAPQLPVPRSARVEIPFREVLGVDAAAGVFVLYQDRAIYVEGQSAWVRGGETTSFAVTGPPSGTSVEALLINGPVPQEVTLAAGETTERLFLAGRETRPVTLRLPAGVTRFPVSITSPAGFRPSEVEPGSRDNRWLGVRVTWVGASTW